MATKAKKKLHKMPPLSTGDLLIYWLLFLVLIALDLAAMIFPFWMLHRRAFADEAVVAASMTAGIIWSVPSYCVLTGVTIGLWGTAYRNRWPIFGKRNFKYGPPAWPKVYPLFMKNKPYVWVSKHAVERRRRNALLLLILVAVSFLPYPLSWSGRHCLRQDGSVAQYNAFNIKTRDFTSGQIDRVELEAYTHRKSRKNPTRIADVRVVLTTDTGKRYIFDHDEFRDCTWNGNTDWLPAMVALKERYRPEIITYAGTGYLEKVILDNRLSPQQQTMLYELFDQSYMK